MRGRRKSLVVVSAWLALSLAIVGCAGGASDDPEDDVVSTTSPTTTSPTETTSSEATDEAPNFGEPVELTFATWIGEQSSHMQTMAWWMNELESRTNGVVTVIPYYQGALLGLTDLLPGAGDGRVDLAHTSPLFHPSELPLGTVAQVPFTTRNNEAQIRAFRALLESNDSFAEEFSRQNVKNIMYFGAGQPLLGLNDMVESLDDLDGLSVRALSPIADVLAEVGVDPQAIPVGEIYEGIQRGLIDGWTSSPMEGAVEARLDEVTEYWYDLGLGNFAVGMIVMNLDTWEGLNPEVQKVIEDLNTEVVDKFLFEFEPAGEDAACDYMLASNARLLPFPEEAQDQLAELAGDPVLDAWFERMETAGVDGVQFYEEYLNLLAGFEADSDWEPHVDRCFDRQ